MNKLVMVAVALNCSVAFATVTTPAMDNSAMGSGYLQGSFGVGSGAMSQIGMPSSVDTTMKSIPSNQFTKDQLAAHREFLQGMKQEEDAFYKLNQANLDEYRRLQASGVSESELRNHAEKSYTDAKKQADSSHAIFVKSNNALGVGKDGKTLSSHTPNGEINKSTLVADQWRPLAFSN